MHPVAGLEGAPQAHRTPSGRGPGALQRSVFAERLRGILNTQPEQPRARAIAVTTGTLIAGAVSMVINPSGSLLEAGLMGAALGSLWQELALGWRQAEREHQQRWEQLNRFGGGRALIARDGIHADDRGAVAHAHTRIIEAMQKMQKDFQQHCQDRQLPCNPLINQVLQAFFLEFCGENEACTLYCRREQCFYLTAVSKGQLAEALRQCGNDDRPTAEVLSSLGVFHLRCDPQCKDLEEMTTFNLVLRDTECRVQPQRWPTPASGHGMLAGPFADAYRGLASTIAGTPLPRRCMKASGGPETQHIMGSESPAVKAQALPKAFVVEYSDRLRRQLSTLAEDDPTRVKLEAIATDLRCGRPVGHSVLTEGRRYLSTDINIEGLAGRNRWRLLYARCNGGYMLEGIVDYHAKRIAWR